MRRHTVHGHSAADERIARLEAELGEARRDVVDMAPSGLAGVLRGYHSCASREEHHLWEREVVAAAVARAAPEPDSLRWQPRALCPLCRSGGVSPYETGYTLPLGLSRHLEGFGKVRRCPVPKAAFRLARDYLRDRFLETEEVARRLEEGRRSNERLYLIAPWSAPKLLDEGTQWGRHPPRSPQSLQAAERHLADLGFRTGIDGAVVSHRLDRDGCEAFADPRADKRIDFVVCRGGARSGGAHHRTFYLLDGWNDHGAKFAKRLAGAVGALAAPPASARHGG